ncbi:MAG: Gfo/Idh/MocA family oxidoreductase [Phycisphaerales bacterium]|nr:Gfo/Idh/MocA family oxidoreductase [Phycisphaerales bacterium]
MTMPRREFVKAAAVASVLPSIARGAHARGSDTLKIGLIGCGGRGTGAASQALRADPGNVLWAMGDMFDDRLTSCHERLTDVFKDAPGRIDVAPERRFLGFDAHQRVIDAGVDVVLLTSYPHFRPSHLEAAVHAGKHVFCEKPMGVDAPGLVRVRAASELAREKGLTLVSGFCWRYANAERAAFAKLHEGVIGDVLSVHTTYHTSTLTKRPRRPEWSDMEFQLRNWWHFTWLSGDHIVEQACHSIDRLAWAMNDKTPARCVAIGGRAARTGEESGNSFDHFGVVYEYDDRRRAFHTCTQIDRTPSDNSDYITGSSGTGEINGWKPIHAFRDRTGKVIWSYEGPSRDMYQNEHDVLFASIRAGEARNDGPWMCNSTMMALMGRMAAYTGQTITWDQAWASVEDLSPPAYEMGPLAYPALAVPGQTPFR